MSLPGYDVSCEICMYAAEHGSWPPSHRGTHCGFEDGCHRSWTAPKEAHCVGLREDGSVCHAHFSTDKLADKHRRGGLCLDPAETTSKTGEPVFRLCTTPRGETIWRSADAMPLKPEYAR